MSVILRVDVDRAYMKQPQDYLRTYYGVFPAIDSLGYLEHCKKMADDLDNRGIRASFFFLTSTLPKSDFAQDLLSRRHSIGLHAVQTQDFSRFSKELDKISRRFDGKVYGFTKHGSGKLKLALKHDPYYDVERYIEYAKKANLKYFSGNGENPEDKMKVVDGIVFFPSAFWINRNYRADKFTVDWLVEESNNRDIVVLIHPSELVTGTELLRREYERILDRVNKFITIDEVFKGLG